VLDKDVILRCIKTVDSSGLTLKEKSLCFGIIEKILNANT